MERQIIIPSESPHPACYYSHGIRVGAVLYSAGQTSRNVDGELVGIGNATQQAKQTFHNLSLVLKEGGMGFQNVVRLKIFVRWRADLPEIMKVKDQYFHNHRPALTITVVKSLANREYLLDVEVIARAD